MQSSQMKMFREWRHPLKQSLLEMDERTREVDRLLEDVRENVGAPSSQRRQRRSRERYAGYMALFRECVKTEPSSFEEEV